MKTEFMRRLYRVIYAVSEKEEIVRILKVRHRKNAYKKHQ
ncbi:MAG: hypothetical protein HQL03_14180 [Nitrospirae bacterium]|nr:hypothetical protein [Nitrospirota bacterium]MBF0593122.1 hypothetical protein [Nitrospirota bacterium]